MAAPELATRYIADFCWLENASVSQAGADDQGKAKREEESEKKLLGSKNVHCR